MLRALIARTTAMPKRARYVVAMNGEGPRARRKRQIERGMLRAGR